MYIVFISSGLFSSQFQTNQYKNKVPIYKCLIYRPKVNNTVFEKK